MTDQRDAEALVNKARAVLGNERLRWATPPEIWYEVGEPRGWQAIFELQIGGQPISFALLEQLSAACETKLIDFETWRGFGGSDVTGAEPDEVRLRIRWSL